MSEMQRKGENVSKKSARKCKKITHILANTQARDKSVYRDQGSERYTQPRECRVGGESQNTKGKKAIEGHSRSRWRKEKKNQDMERMRASKGHSLPEERRQRDNSGQGKNLSERGALTSWKAQTEGQVRTWKETK
jgi:hypothetical protein